MDIICGRIYRNGIHRACIGIENGKIVAIAHHLEGKKTDYGNALIFPAAVDIHVHFREPGQEYKEDFFTGTRAAALSGVTCVLDMPNNRPAIVTKDAFEEKAALVRDKACIDFGLYGGITEKFEDMPCIAYKTFLSKDNEIFCSSDRIEHVLRAVKGAEKPLVIHAELEECIERDTPKNLKEHERSRRAECEIAAVREVLKANGHIHAKIHFCHLTTPEAVEMAKGRASYGVTPHHLLFSCERSFTHEAWGKVNPPLRSERERKKLYEHFIHGEIPILESDHAPHTSEEKEDFEQAPSGMPGVDAMIPLMLYRVKRGDISLGTLFHMVCKNPAAFFGIPKGSIEVGKDADFMVIDFEKEQEIKPRSKCGWSPYKGWPCIYPSHVYLRGEKIVEEYEFVGGAGMGKMIQ